MLCDEGKKMRAHCTVCPSEAPERLGLKVFRARGYRGGKQQKIRWSKTMVWFPSAPSQMCMGRGAGNQQVCACCEHARKRRQVSGPRVILGSEWPGRGAE